MKRKHFLYIIFSGVTALFFVGCSGVSAANKVVVIPLSKTVTTTCTAPDEVQSAGYCWKDRNLGATRVALSSTDTHAYGSRYQWGRLGDGHQNETSATTTTLSGSDVPGHSKFIIVNVDPWDWRIPQNHNLWQGVSGDNNPCPQGFRLPTETELTAEIASWGNGFYNAVGAFESPLHLTVAGVRGSYTGMLNSVGTDGAYWSSTGIIFGDRFDSRWMHFDDDNASMGTFRRAFGLSVRCLKD
jgi:hypothetical protein